MKKRILIIPLIVLYLIGLVYLSTPSAVVPDLSDSLRSDEPGDTWQHPEQKAFYTDKTRSVVLTELQNKYSSVLNNFRFLSFRLNYRPEEVEELVRDQLRSYYLEEVIHPLKESMFINGWEPENSPIFTNDADRGSQLLFINGRKYLSKVTMRPIFTQNWARYFIWTAAFPGFYLALVSFKKSLNS